jgi:hypothetical protein
MGDVPGSIRAARGVGAALGSFRYRRRGSRLEPSTARTGGAMPNRREFLQTGAAVSAVGVGAIVPRGAPALGAAPRPSVAIHAAIVDDRYALASGFAAAFEAHGVPVRTLDDGDITRFFVDELEPLWRTAPAAIAGLTQFGPMLVVSQLAAERRLRTVLRVEHRADADGVLAHVATASADVLGWLEGAAARGIEWPALMALAACRCEVAAAPLETATLRLPGGAPELSALAAARALEEPAPIHYYTPRGVQQGYGLPADGPLYSWLVAPRATAGER